MNTTMLVHTKDQKSFVRPINVAQQFRDTLYISENRKANFVDLCENQSSIFLSVSNDESLGFKWSSGKFSFDNTKFLECNSHWASTEYPLCFWFRCWMSWMRTWPTTPTHWTWSRQIRPFCRKTSKTNRSSSTTPTWICRIKSTFRTTISPKPFPDRSKTWWTRSTRKSPNASATTRSRWRSWPQFRCAAKRRSWTSVSKYSQLF